MTNLNINSYPFTKESLGIPIRKLKISERAFNVLKTRNIVTLKDIINFGFKNIIYLPNSGVKTVREISRVIEPFVKIIPVEEFKPYDSNPTFEEQIRNCFDKKLLSTSIKQLGLSVRAYNVLKSIKIETINDLIEFGLYNIIKLLNSEVKTLKDMSNIVPFKWIMPGEELKPYDSNPPFEELIKNCFDNKLLNIPIEELDCSLKESFILEKAGIKTIKDIIEFGPNNIAKLPKFGIKKARRILSDIELFAHDKTAFEKQIRNSCDDKFLNTPIKQLNISVRTYNVLKSNKLRTIKDIIGFGLKNIAKLPNVGIKKARIIFSDIELFIHDKTAFEKQKRKSSDDKYLNTPIKQLNISVRTYNVLKSNKLRTIKDIIGFGLKNIIKLPSAGIKTIQEIFMAIELFINDMTTFEEQIISSFDEKLLSIPIKELDISARASSAFRKVGLKNINDILVYGLHNLQKMKNVNCITIDNIKNEILKLPAKVSQELVDISFIAAVETIFSSITLKNMNFIKARYAYDDEKCITLEEISNKIGITREGVRQIIVRELERIKHHKNKKVLESIIKNIERLLFKYKGIVSINDVAKDKYFTSGTQKQIRFLMNVITDIYKERYKVIYKNYLTNLNDDEIKIFQSEIHNTALRCQLPMEQRAFIENIISSVGRISEDYLNYHLLNNDRIEILEGKVVSLGWRTITQRIKILMKDSDRPMHFMEIAKLYREHLGIRKESSNLERAIHSSILGCKDFIIIDRGTYMLRSRFKIPDNIKEIVEVSKEILRMLENISDIRYLIKELKKRKIDIRNLNVYSLKSILREYPDFVFYRKFKIGIEELTNNMNEVT